MKDLAIKKFALLMVICFVSIFCVGAAGGMAVADVSWSDVGGSVLAIAIAAVPAIPVFDYEKLTVVTRQEFEALQAKYGKLYIVNIEIDETESYQYILRRPTRQHLELIEHHKDSLTKANDIIIKNMVVAGDTEALNDGIVYAGFGLEAGKIVQQARSFLYRA